MNNQAHKVCFTYALYVHIKPICHKISYNICKCLLFQEYLHWLGEGRTKSFQPH